ncbi:MAG: hypothetical protein CL477_01995 [Acidobacteria bacterium]|jgi:hypothetical protein|nr:hypothetical protein [Acidobacteriota bacterium]|tara:strand:+ start:1071 stop:3272 length:2202 start_codon:yes stop_codon:yes gene_type:complete
MRETFGAGLLAALCLVVGILLWMTSTAAASADDISGVVQGTNGTEAGVWVIAETDDFDTTFRKIVVTDDAGRFVVPDIPVATYQVWVRGYGLADSEKTGARPGDDLTLTARVAATPNEAADVYPGNYWYSLLEMPPPSEFPGTGPNGNGIPERMQTQAQWIDILKDRCELCHQLGNKATREIPNIEDFDSTLDAWDHRVQVGGAGASMVAQLDRLGRDRTIKMFADWTDRITAGEVPPPPPRPQGVERNVVLTMWAWGSAWGSVHDEIATDKRNPRLYPDGPVYGVGGDGLVIMDPVANHSVRMDLAPRVQRQAQRRSARSGSGPPPSPYWGNDRPTNQSYSAHNPMMDDKGRVWITQWIRPSDNPDWCKEGSDHSSAQYFPIERNIGDTRQISYYDPGAEKFVLIDTCFETHHLQFAEDDDDTLWLSGSTDVVGWLNTRAYDETGDERASQGWCPTVVDTNGDGRITRPWNEPTTSQRELTRSTGNAIDPALDTRFTAFAYGIIPNPVDGSIWIARRQPLPGSIVRLDLGDNPPETCSAEYYEAPFENPAVDADQWGYGPRGIDVDRNGLIWTALGGSGHLASFDRSKCTVLNGPTATGQHCPEGWTLYQSPGPTMKGVEGSANADFHYYAWVDQFDTLGLGANVPIATGSSSDALLALMPETAEWVVLRVPYPLGFYSKGLDGRIDDPDGGWKGRGLWASYDSSANWHNEGGKGMTSQIVRFQIRPDPLAE